MSASNGEIVQRIESLLASAKKLQGDDQYGRFGLLKEIDLLYQDVEPPINTFFKQWTSLTFFSCIDIAIKLGLFEHMKGRESITAKELGALVNVDDDVIARVMRVLVASRFVASKGEDAYAHTHKSLVYVKGEHTAVDSFNLISLLAVSYITIPEYLKTRSADELVDIRKTPYACAYGMEGKTFYEVLSTNPDHLDTFNRSMSEPGPEWGMFPFESLRENVLAEPERPFVVDIGGGKGQALLRIQEETGKVFGTSSQLILQERPDVLEQINQDDIAGITKMPYDFHTKQPVKDAHVYFFSQIIHNYPDHVCQDILKQAAGAMGPSSRLLIVEAVLPAQTDVGGDMGAYLIDFVGLAMGGKERTEKEFATLLGTVGLELVKVWHGKARHHAIVEARLKRA
uniref:O-methyltransferase hmp5 n=1 Tax=Hypomyces subiculosus TaxID=193393 RepID=HPM5_HYPSB|nr:RecName: Full=O-methyltransferase hmp5; AltName: Full=Hypothemycin biosynthesis cluster protein hpm5 [Hypomyces subiculosus]ACD39755.1 O-methyltransferase [Hypomyces subiculosus]ACD39764.1 O-methyltransferase [Hypomyces subiculosus]